MLVGTKELKNRLSHYLRKARAGEIVRVTDRGVVIAELRHVQADAGDDAAKLGALEAEGTVTKGDGRAKASSPVRLRAGTPLSRMISDDRG